MDPDYARYEIGPQRVAKKETFQVVKVFHRWQLLTYVERKLSVLFVI